MPCLGSTCLTVWPLGCSRGSLPNSVFLPHLPFTLPSYCLFLPFFMLGAVHVVTRVCLVRCTDILTPFTDTRHLPTFTAQLRCCVTVLTRLPGYWRSPLPVLSTHHVTLVPRYDTCWHGCGLHLLFTRYVDNLYHWMLYSTTHRGTRYCPALKISVRRTFYAYRTCSVAAICCAAPHYFCTRFFVAWHAASRTLHSVRRCCVLQRKENCSIAFTVPT